MLADGARCSVMLVTVPEETPINELVESAYQLEDEVGIKLGPVIVNNLLPNEPHRALLDVRDPATAAREDGLLVDQGALHVIEEAGAFALNQVQLQQDQLARLSDALAIPRLILPSVFVASAGPDELAEIAERPHGEAIGALT